uniref:Kelch like family member 30 n=1 Tax=Tetraodon nigroviridis TaxID=99883 RepID=H3CNW6_TETNG
MVRDVDDLDFCLSSHPQSMLEGLRSLCSQPKMVDVTLSAGGRDFPCHRAVLALCSQYFHSMFSGDFVESITSRVELQGVDPDILSSLVDFAYTGKLTINQNNVEGLICTSSQLQFQTVRTVCSRYLQHQIHQSNCLGILEFGAVHGCPEVMAKAWAFLLENFEAIQQGEEFLQLEKARLVACLADEGLQVRNESTRVDAILKWVKHHAEARLLHLPELLRLSRLCRLTLDYISNTLLQDGLLQSCPRSAEEVQRIYREKMSLASELRDRPSHQSPRPNLQDVLVVMGSHSLDDSDSDDSDEEEPREPLAARRGQRNCAFYNTKTKKWYELPSFPNPNKWGYSMVSLNNDVYVTGGSRGPNTNSWSTTETWKYVTREEHWTTVAPMTRARTNHASTALNGEIYVIGGTTADHVEVEHYDPYSNTWNVTSPALKYVSNFTATACHGKLYVIGSCAVKYNALTMQCYNPVTESWISMSSPFMPRYLSSPRSACMDGIIYLVADNTKKVFSYNPEENIWQKVQHLHVLHENGGLVAMDGKLFVTGGHWKGMEGDYSVEVEAYHPPSDSWELECFLPRLWFYSGVCTIFLDPAQRPQLLDSAPGSA